MISPLVLCICVLILLVSSATPAATRDEDTLVGVYYFAGWWKEQPNKYILNDRDWRKDYPERIPLLGDYNDQKTMDREIAAAESHGIDFFQILWYRQDPNLLGEVHHKKLNEGIRLFMNSRKRKSLKFTLEFVNHPPFAITTDADWDSACRYWIKVMKHPAYLRVGGRPVFKIHGLHHFLNQNGGDLNKVKERLERFREIAREERLPTPLISAGVGLRGIAKGPDVQPYDFLTVYMDMPDVPANPTPYPYSELLAFVAKGWKSYATEGDKPFVPLLPTGWDPRPWSDPRPPFTFPTKSEWLDALRRAKSALDSNPKLGAPSGKQELQKMLLIYAWNEFAEGGIVAPTKGEGYMKLEAVKEVFGNRSQESGSGKSVRKP